MKRICHENCEQLLQTTIAKNMHSEILKYLSIKPYTEILWNDNFFNIGIYMVLSSPIK